MSDKHYAPGQLVGGVKILELRQNAGTYVGMYYLVEYACCGTKRVMRHSRISERVKQGATKCLECNRRNPTKAKGPYKARNQPVQEIPGAFDNRGFLWPTLGQLGFRAAALDTASKQRRAHKKQQAAVSHEEAQACA
jgi:hypothetical protein